MKNPKVSQDKIRMAKEISKAIEENKQIDGKSLGLSDDKINKIKAMLSDKDTVERLMASKEAQELLKKYGKE